MRKALEAGEGVKLSGFGNFQLRDKPQRPGRNPKTGEEIPITARRVVTFHASQKLKAMVDKNYHGRELEPDSSKPNLPPIPAKRYFTIGEVSELCGVKPHVLRYWEQEFTQLKPVKRRGNRRYYQHHEVLLIRRIRQLLYEEGFTISGARHRLDQAAQRGAGQERRRCQGQRGARCARRSRACSTRCAERAARRCGHLCYTRAQVGA